MIRCTPWILAVLLVAATAHVVARQAPPPGSGSLELDGTVRVIEGDTLEVFVGGYRVGIGLIGLNAPRGNSACGRQATARLDALTAHGLRLTEDPDPALAFDARKRRMYYGFTPERLSIALVLVSEGLARSDGRGAEREALAAAEQDARFAGRGCVWKR